MAVTAAVPVDDSSSTSSSGSATSMSPAPSDVGSEEPNSAPPVTASIERQTSESVEADAEDDEVDSGSSGRGSDHDSDNSSLSENGQYEKQRTDTDSLPTSTTTYYAAAAPPAPTPALLPPLNAVVESAPVPLPAPVGKHRPTTVSLCRCRRCRSFLVCTHRSPTLLPFEPFHRRFRCHLLLHPP